MKGDGYLGAVGGGPSSGDGGLPFSPSPGVTWQAQLSGNLDLALNVQLFYLDPFVVPVADLQALRDLGRHYVCYLSAGSFEPWRDDAPAFPGEALGNALENYPREQWLDIRDPRIRELMAERIRTLAAFGCAGVSPAALDLLQADTGFDIMRADVLDYAEWLAARIHAAGMSAGLSTPEELVSDLEPVFDWGLAIDCLSSDDCSDYVPLRAKAKAVLLVEFGDSSTLTAVCPAASGLGFDALIKRRSFDGFRVACSDNP